MRKLILFGAGKYGRLALEKYGKENVFCFCDNSVEKQGTKIEGLPVYSLDEMAHLYNEENHTVMIANHNVGMMIGQLSLYGIKDYLVFPSQENILGSRTWVEDHYKEQNSLLDEFVKKSHQKDLLEDVSAFREISAEVLRRHKEEGLVLFHLGYQGEGHYYGNLENLIRYSGITNFDLKYAPVVSHNATLPLYSTEVQYRDAVIMSGEYYYKKIHQHYPYMPVFTVGPYIQYAEGIYSDQKVRELKKRNGKTAVVFLPHSIEDIGRKYSKNRFIDDVLKLYGNRFEHFLLCAYWADINEEACIYATQRGMQLVTAGFRFDTTFNNRLKTILDLADAVIGGDRGTHFMYALHMGKDVARIDISDDQTIHDDEFTSEYEKQLQFNDTYIQYNKQFYSLLDQDLKNTEEQRAWIQPYCGFGIKRSPDYIRNVLEISRDILNNCDGYNSRYPDAVRKTYLEYDEQGLIDKMSILKSATGTYLD